MSQIGIASDNVPGAARALPPAPFRRDTTGCPFDPDPALTAAPGPVQRITLPGGQAWLITGHAEARQVLGSTEVSNARGRNDVLRPPSDGAPVAPLPSDGVLIELDPPEHGRVRRMVMPSFTARRMARLRPRIQAIVDEHLDALAEAGPGADLVATFALPIPSLVISELLGVPYADRGAFQRRTREAFDVTLTPERMVEQFTEMNDYMRGLVTSQRRSPGDDLFGDLVRDHGEDLSDNELTGLGNLLLTAGHETTANMLGIGTLLLLDHPDEAAVLRDGDPTTVARGIEELLRYLSVVPTTVERRVMADLDVGGTTLHEGDTVLVSLPVANRDPDKYADPTRLDLQRGADQHLAFGHGIHHCLGAPLARVELQLALPALLRRFPTLRLACDRGDLAFRTMAPVYGVEALPVTW